MRDIIRNFFVAIVALITLFVTVYYCIMYVTNGKIIFDSSDVLMIIFFGILSLIIVFMMLYINLKLNIFSDALVDISTKIDMTEENIINLEKSTQRIILKEVKENKKLRESLLERMDYAEKSKQQPE